MSKTDLGEIKEKYKNDPDGMDKAIWQHFKMLYRHDTSEETTHKFESYTGRKYKFN